MNNRIKYHFFAIIVLLTSFLNAQTVLFSDDFESYGANFTPTGATAGWRSVTFTSSNNRWEVNNAAACLITGNRSLMITNNGTTCTYNKTDNCDKIAYNATPFSTAGYGCLSLSFDAKVTGEAAGGFAFDYLQVYYNIGAGWVALSGAILLQTGTVSAVLPLPAAVNNQASVYIGFDWINDNSGGADVPAVVDNIVVKGSNAAAPANNPCASASAMTFTGTTATIVGNNACATADVLNPTCYNTQRNVWHTFVAPATGNYYASLAGGTMTYPVFSVLRFTSACVAGTATQMGCGAYNGSSYASLSACTLTAGQTYYVMVDNYGDVGTYTLTITQAISNDLITTPAAINSCGTTFTSSTIGATNCGDGTGSGTGVNNNVDNNAATGGYTGGGDVGFSVENSSWYNFCNASGANATYTITGTNAGSCTGPNGIQFAYFTGTNSSLSLSSGGTSGMNILSGNSFVSTPITLANGACAFVMVDGYAGTNCNYNISVAASPICQILPVSFLSFDGYANGSENILKWATASELNSKEFNLEKSKDGTDYQIFNSTKAAGNSNIKIDYEEIDSYPFESGTYYRLKQVNLDGSFKYTNPIFIDSKNSNKNFDIVALKPNPTTSNSIIRYTIPYKGTLQIEMYDNFGNLISDKEIKVNEGIFEDQINLNRQASGVYFIRATFDGTVKLKTILKAEN